jgi:hypothetical protein
MVTLELINFDVEIIFFGFSSLIKDHQQRPKYGPLMHHSFFIQSSEQSVDIAGWYRDVTTKVIQK